MQLIYIDEAGISAKEPVLVVVAVMVEADKKWKIVESAINDLFDKFVPAKFREGFIFHGTDIYSGGKYREDWSFPDRLDFFKRFMSLVIQMKIPLSISMIDRRNHPGSPNSGKLSSEKFEHIMAYMICVDRADRYLRNYSKSHELGVVVVEDTPGMKKYFKMVHDRLKKNPIEVSSDMLYPYSTESNGETFKISNIVDCPHFVDKTESPMIQLADALAFALRRYFAGLKNGDDLVFSTFGEYNSRSVFNKEQWGRPLSGNLVYFD